MFYSPPEVIVYIWRLTASDTEILSVHGKLDRVDDENVFATVIYWSLDWVPDGCLTERRRQVRTCIES